MLLRGAVSAYASEVVANVENCEPFGVTHPVVTLQTFHSREREVARAAQAQGFRAQSWDTFLMQHV